MLLALGALISDSSRFRHEVSSPEPIQCKQEGLVNGIVHHDKPQTLHNSHAKLRLFERNTCCAHPLLQICASNSAQAGEAIIDVLFCIATSRKQRSH